MEAAGASPRHAAFFLDFGFSILDYFLLFYIFLFAFLAAGMSVGDGGGLQCIDTPVVEV